MTDLILLLQADHDIQTAFNRYEEFQAGRGEIFMRHLDAALTHKSGLDFGQSQRDCVN